MEDRGTEGAEPTVVAMATNRVVSASRHEEGVDMEREGEVHIERL